MKMTLNDARVRFSNLMELSNKHLPVKLSYAIGKNIIKFKDEVDLSEKKRIELAERYAKKDDKGTPMVENGEYAIETADKEQFKKEVEELLKEEIDVDIRIVSMTAIETVDETRYDALTPAEIVSIDFMMSEEGGKEHE